MINTRQGAQKEYFIIIWAEMIALTKKYLLVRWQDSIRYSMEKSHTIEKAFEIIKLPALALKWDMGKSTR